MFFLISFLYFTAMAPKTMDFHPPALPQWSPLLSLLSSVIGACFWLVVVCNFIDRRPPKVTVYFLFDIFCVEFVASNDWTPPSHTFQPPHISSPTSFLPWPPTPSWLLCVADKRRPPKATVYFKFEFFFTLNLLPPTIGCRPPIRSNPHMPPLKHPFYHGRQLPVDCCLLLINGGHLRPTHYILSIFWCGLFWCPKWEPASMASNN